jgi:Fe-S-cluster-containing hydrogenase component 2
MEYPVCVDVCPTKALELLALNDLEQVIQAKRHSIVEQFGTEKRKGLVVLGLENDAAI